jgi:peptide-methionine (S)-S-oxide reductase
MDSCRIPIPQFPNPLKDTLLAPEATERKAVLAGGCFWCTEAVFKELRGVLSVRSGYSGGTKETAEYRAVCSGGTNHAEAIEIRYDASQVSFGKLLKIFFSVAHDPTQVDQQGNDVGRQYRSVIFYADEEQRVVAESYIRQLNDEGVFSSPIATRVEPLTTFYEAESYHQDYAKRNPEQSYIVYAAKPKVEKLRKHFGDELK